MARAKRTQRADARRRYRQTAAVEPELGEVERPSVTTASPSSTARRPAPTSGPPLGFTDSMRAAWHRPDIRADIAALPSLIVTPRFLAPLGLVVVSVLSILLTPPNAVSSLLYAVVVVPPAMAPIFIVGFFAKRASYLLGLIISVVDLIGFAIIVYVILAPGDPAHAQQQKDAVLEFVAIGPLSGIFFAAGAAWYRRFLAFSGAQRMRQRGQQRPGQRSGQQRSKASKPARG